jgi:phosphoribosylformylglycinamidine synthase
MILTFYRRISENFEHCYYVDTEPLGSKDTATLKWLLAETFQEYCFGQESFFGTDKNVVEIGPKLNFQTPYSTNAVAICVSCGITGIKRLEKSKRYLLPKNVDRDSFIKKNHDRMTESVYETKIITFDLKNKPEKFYEIKLIEDGKCALEEINTRMGLGMDKWDINFYYEMFVRDFKRNPTNIECFQLGQINSEHSRHWFFKGRIFLDDVEMKETLFEIVKSTLLANPEKSLISFKDNSSSINGYSIPTIIPKLAGGPTSFEKKYKIYNPLFTAETHNFPSGIAPVPGGETGTGGRIRDVHATGTGSLVIAGTAGFCVGNLNIPDYPIPGEDSSCYIYPRNVATPIKILINVSFGAYDYGNKFGEPCIQGFTRTFGITLPNYERREWIKPIMFTGGVGQIDLNHIKKKKPTLGMKIVQIGGPAYRIGVGGGSASSMVQGENKDDLDFNAVQRGDAEMKQKVNRVIRACVEMDSNPILSIHDQGAAGPCNVLTEIVEEAGGKIDIRKIVVGDVTMSVLEIWGAEYQERDAILIHTDRLEEFKALCFREKVNCEVLGEITGNNKITMFDSNDRSTPVDLDLKKILGEVPQKIFKYNRKKKNNLPLSLPQNITIDTALKKIFSLPSVGSKSFLVHKVDRSVTGLIAQQQCVGPLQLPVANVSVVANSHFDTTGTAIAIGEQPLKMLVDCTAGARMALGEMLTNLMWAKISSIRHIKSSVNWMWAAKLDTEGAELFSAAVALRDIMQKTGVAIDGGKDSLSMATKVDDKIVKSPGQMTVSAYVTVPDITKVITPDIKKPGESKLIYIDLGSGKNRMGGSAIAQAHGQIGKTSPDVDDPKLLVQVFEAVQNMIEKNLILSGHDKSDGGLITTLIEMAMSGNCGIKVSIDQNIGEIRQLFSEELGIVIEYLPEQEEDVQIILRNESVPFRVIGTTTKEKVCEIKKSREIIFLEKTSNLLEWWQATSDRLEEEQMNTDLARQQASTYNRVAGPKYNLSFVPNANIEYKFTDRPKIAIIREEGSNGDREMTSAFYMAGFDTWDISMFDLLNNKISLNDFRGIAFVGGFSYADVLDSAKGWAGTIKFNPLLRKIFTDFYNRPDTFSFGVCNGCQLMALLGWVPGFESPTNIQPRFIQNDSKKFESRWTNVKIQSSPAIMLKGMTDSNLGVWVAHGEGRFHCPDQKILTDIQTNNLVPLSYVDDSGSPTEIYPYNPNGSTHGIAGLCSTDGRHLALMPHPERSFLKWQWPYMPEDWKKDLKASPWLKMFQNARDWCNK